MATTFDLFYLGAAPEIDTVEGNLTSENDQALEGLVFGGSSTPLANDLRTLSPDATSSYTGGSNANAYDADNNLSTEQFIIDGVTLTHDTTMVYLGSQITYTDGTTAFVDAIVMQDTNGGLYLLPPSTGPNAYSDALEAKPIESLTLGTANPANGTDTYGMAADRYDLDVLDYVVDGTAGDDLIDVSYTGDPEGDRIDNTDNLNGTNADSVVAGDGDDTVVSGSGNDTLLGGEGADNIDGGADSDLIQGDTESVNITDYTSPPADTATNLTVTNSADAPIELLWIDGTGTLQSYQTIQPGDTFVQPTFENHNWVLRDPDGNIVKLIEGAPNQTVNYGADGLNDSLQGGAGNDTIEGQFGDDTLDGGIGDDTLVGQSGDDTFLLGDNFGNDSITGGETGETNGDTLDLSNVTTDTTVDLTSTDPEAGSVSDGSSTATFTEIETIVLGSGTDTVVLADGSGSDTVGAFEAPVDNGDGTFTGQDQLDVSSMTDADGNLVNVADVTVTDDGSGNAVLTFPNGENITLLGVAPADVSDHDALAAMGIAQTDYTVTGTAAGELIDATYSGDPDGDFVDNLDSQTNTNDDSIVAGAGDDTIYGGLGNDTIEADEGNDEVFGGDGADSIFGFEGSDTVDGGAGDDFINTRTSPGTGLPDQGYADTSGSGLSYPGDTDPNNDRDSVLGGDGNDTILTGDDNDTIFGGTGADSVDAGFDDDSIAGEAGNDTLEGNDGNDTVDGGADDDLIYGDVSPSNPDYPIYAAYELPNDGTDDLPDNNADSLSGGTGNDTIYGQDDDDTLLGGDGNDVLDGGLDNDSLLGEAGTDSLVGGHGDDVLDGGADNDTLFGGDGSDTLLGGTGDDVLDGDNAFSTGAADLISGGDGNDEIIGDVGNDTLSGDAGNDTIYAGADDDLIDGGTGSDLLFGEAGDDAIIVDQGDTAFGGDGDDTFTLQDLDTTGTGNAAISITGGEGGETNGDTLILTQDVTQSDIVFSNEDDAAGGLSGSFTMDDGTVVQFSEIENIICFTPGTNILTQHGERPIETLRIGDMVVTRDHGLRQIRWIGQRSVRGHGDFAPVRIGTNVMDGARCGLLVSPQHRILFTGYRAELLFGESEVLVPAKHLIDGLEVVQEDQDEVTYIHIMFDSHEVIYAEGIATESFHAGDVGLSAICEAAREELFAIFPELRTAPGHHLETARTCLKRHEARLLVHQTGKTTFGDRWDHMT